MHRHSLSTLLATILTAAACSRPPTADKSAAATTAPTPPSGPAASFPAATTAPALPSGPTASSPATAQRAGPPTTHAARSAEIGQRAPNFVLRNLDGKRIKLAGYLGKIVVLEWFNPGCPFVKLAHTKGSLVDTAARHSKTGVVWLAINSGAAGKQGHGVEANRKAKQAFRMDHPVLLDESGTIGRVYGAERTPHLFVVNPAGMLVYAGAIDNSPDAEGEAAEGGTLVNYVDAAIEAVQANQPVATPRTKPYGCTVKY